MMKMILVAVLLATGLSINSQNLDSLLFGTDSTLDIMTWNIERFPKNGQTTLMYVADIIEAADVDVIALQEIDDKSSFEELVDNLDGWEGFHTDAEFAPLAYLYKPDIIAVREIYQIYTDQSRAFPRPPFVMDLEYEGERIILINNHLKCCGDGELESGDNWDEETRRLHASNMLEEYVHANFPGDNVMILGDLNDILTDYPDDNVFKAFTDAPDKYTFADMKIANGNFSGWSYPKWPSHLDHILVTNELFEVLESNVSDIQTIRVDEYLEGGFDEYEENVSDHRPVALKIDLDTEVVSTRDLTSNKVKFFAYPNPFRYTTTMTFESAQTSAYLGIYNSAGLKVGSYSMDAGQSTTVWESEGQSAGVYYAVLLIDKELAAIAKLLKVD